MRHSQKIEACIEEIRSQGFDKHHVCKVSKRKLKVIIVWSCAKYDLDKDYIIEIGQFKL